MHTDPVIPNFVLTNFTILIFCILARSIKEPYVIGYLFAGILLGPEFLHVITDHETINRLGAIGVIFLSFFAGMEMSPKKLSENWLISLVGTLVQVIISVGAIALLGWFFHWNFTRIILIGFVISISSTAVVLKLLEDWKETNTRAGQDVIGILLVQDIVIIPMLIIIGFLGGQKPSTYTIISQIIGGCFLALLTAYLTVKDEINLLWLKYFKIDHEMQLFTALAICFGMASLTSYASLSSALGAYVAGMLIATAKETQWVHHNLLPIRTLFIAAFFLSIGMQVNIHFIMSHWLQLTFLVIITMITNTLINGLILKLLGEDSKVSLYGGALLSQVGEFGYVLSAIGYHGNIINENTYKIIISLIPLTLMVSPIWIISIKKLLHVKSYKLAKI